MTEKIKFKPKTISEEIEINDEYFALFQALTDLTNQIERLNNRIGGR